MRPDAQMSSLTEALTSAKKEIETQSLRLRDLEGLLSEERRAREDAEERANRLERESIKEQDEAESVHTNGDIHNTITAEPEQAAVSDNRSPSPSVVEDTTARLQQRLELMVSEMNEMKLQMERYRERAETAEADRKSLTEMIEDIREDHARTIKREARKRSRSDTRMARARAQTGNDGSGDDQEAEEGEITIIREKDVDDDGPAISLPGTGLQNGHSTEHNGTKQPTKTPNAMVTQRSNRDLMYHGGPVGAIVTVVAIGVAVMAMLNQYPKAER